MIGNSIKYSLFGESHGDFIGMTIHSFPAGIKIDNKALAMALNRRLGISRYSTKRRETAMPEWVSGVLNGVTTGAPLTFILKNKDVKSSDYKELKYIMRPSHADYSAYVKYNGFNDNRGGGIFSGRLTSCLVVAGSLAKQLLNEKQIEIISRVVKLGGFEIPFSAYKDNSVDLSALAEDYRKKIDMMLDQIISDKDSYGGVVRTKVLHFPAGIGEPYFHSLESHLSSYLFAIGGLKAISFGIGEDFANIKGSEANDEVAYNDGAVVQLSNNNGGILGGISTGADIDFSCVFKPTPSICIEQNTIDVEKEVNVKLEIVGRHDPAFVLRTPVIVENVTAMALLDIIKGNL